MEIIKNLKLNLKLYHCLLLNRKFDNNVLESIRQKGYYIIKNKITEDTCNNIIENLEKNFESYHKYVQKKEDRRIFGYEKICSNVNKIANCPTLLNYANSYCFSKTSNLFTLLNILEIAQVNGSGGSWHRDSLFRQFKALIYLNDVGIDNGPFKIIEKSNDLARYKEYNKKCGFHMNKIRYNDIELAKYLEANSLKEITLTGNKGDCILFDSFSIHRGAPLKSGRRIAATNYYVEEKYINKKYMNNFKPYL